jgi:hypothetical protein
LSSGSLDSVSVTLASSPSTTTARYNIVSTASAPVAGTSQRVSRTAKATVLVTGKYSVSYALAANGNVTIPSSFVVAVNGDARIDGTYTNNSAGAMTGTLLTSSATANSAAAPTFPTKAAPAFSDLVMVSKRPQYWYNNKWCTAEQLTSNLSGVTLQTLNTTTNPANVWYSTAARTLSGNTTIPGTLMMIGTTSNLKISGNIRITPKTGMPGLIVQNDVQYSGSSRKLRVDGIAWVGGNITTDGLAASSSTLEIYGGLMLGSANSTFSNLLSGTGTISYSSTTASNMPADFSTANQTPQNIRIESWTQ